jgi:hypothetical protein
VAESNKRKFVIKYPPDFDGEQYLWIGTRDFNGIRYFDVSFTAAAPEATESEVEMLVRIAKDILRQWEKDHG